MADYFTNFSVVVPLPDQAAQDYALILAEQAGAANGGDQLPADFPALLRDVIEDWVFQANANCSERPGLWLHSSSGGIDAVCAFIQHLLQKYAPQDHVALEWSHDCSKPRVDAYGGGAAFITARKVKTTTTTDWLHKQARLRKGGNR